MPANLEYGHSKIVNMVETAQRGCLLDICMYCRCDMINPVMFNGAKAINFFIGGNLADRKRALKMFKQYAADLHRQNTSGLDLSPWEKVDIQHEKHFEPKFPNRSKLVTLSAYVYEWESRKKVQDDTWFHEYKHSVGMKAKAELERLCNANTQLCAVTFKPDRTAQLEVVLECADADVAWWVTQRLFMDGGIMDMSECWCICVFNASQQNKKGKWYPQQHPEPEQVQEQVQVQQFQPDQLFVHTPYQL